MTADLLTFVTTLVWVLALARVTRFLVADKLTDFLRIWAYKKSHGAESLLTYFVSCPWCVSIWLAFGTAWILWVPADMPLWLYPLVALSGSYIVGLLATNLEGPDEVEVEITDDNS